MNATSGDGTMDVIDNNNNSNMVVKQTDDPQGSSESEMVADLEKNNDTSVVDTVDSKDSSVGNSNSVIEMNADEAQLTCTEEGKEKTVVLIYTTDKEEEVVNDDTAANEHNENEDPNNSNKVVMHGEDRMSSNKNDVNSIEKCVDDDGQGAPIKPVDECKDAESLMMALKSKKLFKDCVNSLNEFQFEEKGSG
jgi:hypothetical protein